MCLVPDLCGRLFSDVDGDRLAPRLALALLLPRHRQSQSGGGAPRRPPHFVLLSSPRAPLDVSLSKDAGWLHQERHFFLGFKYCERKSQY